MWRVLHTRPSCIRQEKGRVPMCSSNTKQGSTGSSAFVLCICFWLLVAEGFKNTKRGQRLKLLCKFCFSGSPADKQNISNSPGSCRHYWKHRHESLYPFLHEGSYSQEELTGLCTRLQKVQWQTRTIFSPNQEINQRIQIPLAT